MLFTNYVFLALRPLIQVWGLPRGYALCETLFSPDAAAAPQVRAGRHSTGLARRRKKSQEHDVMQHGNTFRQSNPEVKRAAGAAVPDLGPGLCLPPPLQAELFWAKY